MRDVHALEERAGDGEGRARRGHLDAPCLDDTRRLDQAQQLDETKDTHNAHDATGPKVIGGAARVGAARHRDDVEDARGEGGEVEEEPTMQVAADDDWPARLELIALPGLWNHQKELEEHINEEEAVEEAAEGE